MNINKIQQQFNINANYCVSVRYSYACSKITELLFFRKIFILPITLDGKTQLEAESDALTIFETINDRGLSLQDADIIKALLYKKAKLAGEEKDFTTEWHSLTIECQDLCISIDDLFRYYFYIVKGVNANSDTSNRLRDYFVRNPKSPLLTHSTSYTIRS